MLFPLHRTAGVEPAPALARALGFRDAYRLLESIPDAEKGHTTACTPGGEQRIGFVTEAGFYVSKPLILAEELARWIREDATDTDRPPSGRDSRAG